MKYYSEKLNKFYDTADACQRAEFEAKEKENLEKIKKERALAEAKEKKERCMMQTTDYVTEYAGFAYASSVYAPSYSGAYVGSRLCLKNSELATYCGRQFIDLWADFKLLSK